MDTTTPTEARSRLLTLARTMDAAYTVYRICRCAYARSAIDHGSWTANRRAAREGCPTHRLPKPEPPPVSPRTYAHALWADPTTALGLALDEAHELFGPVGCGGARTVRQAANYVRRFALRR
jgi:hypothetical protein